MSPRSPTDFRPTRWSLVLQTRGEGEPARRALEELCAAYWFPLYAWSRRSGASPQDAEDHVQSFFLQVLEKRLFAAADPELGKLRSFMLTAFRRHVHDAHKREQRLKRGGGQVIALDPAEAEACYVGEQLEGESAEQMFDRQWALTVLEQALARLERQSITRGKGPEFEVLRRFLTGEGTAAEYETAAAALGLTAGAVKVAVHRLRARFREALRSEVAETQPDGVSIEEEMAHLMQMLRRS